MASTDYRWLIEAKGCLVINEDIHSIVYHASQNVIIVTLFGEQIKVIDATSGIMIKSSDLSSNFAQNGGLLQCMYLKKKDCCVFIDGHALSVRKDMNGVLLLDTALQTTVDNQDECIKIEIPFADAQQLLNALTNTPIDANMHHISDLVDALGNSISAVQKHKECNHKIAKWMTVLLRMPYYVFETSCLGLIQEWKRLQSTNPGFTTPGLPIAASIMERLSHLRSFPSANILSFGSMGKTSMYGEFARRQTFSVWPHMDYKWALPDSMAHAGFYHQPISAGDDNAICFTCLVCLVCWEPSDEPWSEHERHSPSCPYVKGDFTTNVPLSVTCATYPAKYHGKDKEKIACISATCNDDFIATSTRTGSIVIWDIRHVAQQWCTFHIGIALSAVSVQSECTTKATSKEHGANALNQSIVDSRLPKDNKPISMSSKRKIESNLMEYMPPLQSKQSDVGSHQQAPLGNVFVTSLCIIDSSCVDVNSHSDSPTNLELVHPSLVCSVSVDPEHFPDSMNVKLSNTVETVPGFFNNDVLQRTFHGRLPSPYILLFTFDGIPREQVPLVVSDKNSATNRPNGTYTSNDSGGTSKVAVVATDGPNSTGSIDFHASFGSALWQDPDVQFVSFTPGPAQNIPIIALDDGTLLSNEDPFIENGSNELGSFSGIESGGSSPEYHNFQHFHSANFNNYDVNDGNDKKESIPFLHGSTMNGLLLQTVLLPCEFSFSCMEITSICPSIDRQFIIVVISPRIPLSPQKCDFGSRVCESEAVQHISCEDFHITESVSDDDVLHSYGGILVYRVKEHDNRTMLEDNPCASYIVHDAGQIIRQLVVLPSGVEDVIDDDHFIMTPASQLASHFSSEFHNSCAALHSKVGAIGHVILILTDGSMQVLDLTDFHICCNMAPENGDAFTHATYCSGIQRLCLSTQSGKLKFYQVSKHCQSLPITLSVDDNKSVASFDVNSEHPLTSDSDRPTDTHHCELSADQYLASRELLPESLMALHSLIQYEDLMLPFLANAPSCWSEVQQEQQHRRHPQHTQHGHTAQCTRFWNLAPNELTWDEHIFEIVLSKPCYISGVGVEYTLRSSCTVQPNIEVTLLKQNISNISYLADFSDDSEPSSGELENKKHINHVTDPFFLRRNNAEILCGPVQLCHSLFGCSGFTTLSSPELLNCKPLSLLLHLKGLENSGDVKMSAFSGDAELPALNKKAEKTHVNKKAKSVNKTIKGLCEKLSDITLLSMEAEKAITSSANKKVLELKGCDWLLRLSISIQIFRHTLIPCERNQRIFMLRNAGFHERLICSLIHPPKNVQEITVEHFQNIILDILLWIEVTEVNDRHRSIKGNSLLNAAENHLPGLVRSCYIDGSRSTAHKFSRFLILCLEYANVREDAALASSFSRRLLHAMVDDLRVLVQCNSAGAMRWYFSVLNHIKCMDANLVCERAVATLIDVSDRYYSGISPYHALLKTRYGLNGNPLSIDMFDIDLPHNLCQLSSLPVASTTASKSAGIFSVPLATDALNAKANMLSSSSAPGDKSASSINEGYGDSNLLSTLLEESSCFQSEFLRNHIIGLLEVELLSFTCHAASDGTKLECVNSCDNSAATWTGSFYSVFTPSNVTTDDHSKSNVVCSAVRESVSLAAAAPEAIEATSTGLDIADSLKKLASMCTKQLHVDNHPSHLSGQIMDISIGSPGVKYAISDDTPFSTSTITAISTSMSSDNVVTMSSFVSSTKCTVSHSKEISYSSVAYPVPHLLSDHCVQKGDKSFTPQLQTMLQLPADHVICVENMHSGARSFVILDFGRAILLTDVLIPACAKLSSLSIDIWEQGESIDGQRLVVVSDIGTHTLVMNNIMPAPIIRYMKITINGLHGADNTKCCIPIGSFYGHSYIIPWERHDYIMTRDQTMYAGNKATDRPGLSSKIEPASQALLLQNHGLFVSLQEDLQCRYSLSCNRLLSLLESVADAQFVSSHVKYYLSSEMKSEEDAAILQSYDECLQLQLKLNRIVRAIARLEDVIGSNTERNGNSTACSLKLPHTSVDRLRVIIEGLLETLLTLTVPTPALPHPPHSMYKKLSLPVIEILFQNLCLLGSRRIQVSCGLLLTRVCSNQKWWGGFLSNIFQRYFNSEQSSIFPQDRVFILLIMLSQKTLTRPICVQILDRMLEMLGRVLQPLYSIENTDLCGNEHVDLGLVNWVLLYLCCNLDSSSNHSQLSDCGTETKYLSGNDYRMQDHRWSFMNCLPPGQNFGTGKSGKSRKMYRHSLQKMILQHKQRLNDIQAAKSVIDKTTIKHMKDLISLRRNGVELLRCLQTAKKELSLCKSSHEEMSEREMILPRQRCLVVAQGLVSLLLSMDVTCHVDLLLVTCKFLAKICITTRPALAINEIMGQQQLSRLLLLTIRHDNSQGLPWSGPWVSHAVVCLLQDCLQGQKLFSCLTTSREQYNEASVTPACEEYLRQGASSSKTDDGTDDVIDSAAESCLGMAIDTGLTIKDTKLMVDMAMHEFMDDDVSDSCQEPLLLGSSFISSTGSDGQSNLCSMSTEQNADEIIIPPPIDSKSYSDCEEMAAEALKKTDNKVSGSNSTKLSTDCQALSFALDSRLQFGFQWLPDLHTRVMLLKQMDSVFSAYTSVLPTPPLSACMAEDLSSMSAAADELPGFAFPIVLNNQSSERMLGECFEHLFAQLAKGSSCLDSVLQLWLLLNDSSRHALNDDCTVQVFDACTIPTIVLSPSFVTHLLDAVMVSPMTSVRSWLYIFQTLCLLINQGTGESDSGAMYNIEALPLGRDTAVSSATYACSDGANSRTIASLVLTAKKFLPVVRKFFSTTHAVSYSSSPMQFFLVGPTVTNAFCDLFHRLLCKSVDASCHVLKDIMLRIIYHMTEDMGCIPLCLGPLDAQCKFVEMVSALSFDVVDVSNVVSVVASVCNMVKQHIVCQGSVTCNASHANSANARSCFDGQFTQMKRGSGPQSGISEISRDKLMHSLLCLVNKLVQVPLHTSRRPTVGDTNNVAPVDDTTVLPGAVSDSAKLIQASSLPGRKVQLPMSDDEKHKRYICRHISDAAPLAETGHVSNDSSETHGEAIEGDKYFMADIIFTNSMVMQNLMCALSFCSSQKMSGLVNDDALNGPEIDIGDFAMANPLSVGDGIYQVLCSLCLHATDSNVVLRSLLQFFSDSQCLINLDGVRYLSQPLLNLLMWFLDSPSTIKRFLNLDGIGIACTCFVNSCRLFISPGNSLISTVMNSMSAFASQETSQKSSTENINGINFAPFGTIMANSPTASPADSLIHATQPHKRARSAAWSYFFYPEEQWVELVITLPFAILLKHVQIRPHNGMLTTCPSYVSLEVSHDGQRVVPVSPPLVTCSLAVIDLQLLQPEVVNMVVLRVYRPKDSKVVGLQQVFVCGDRAFGGPCHSISCDSLQTHCSMNWLRLLYRCLAAHRELQEDVARAAAVTPSFVTACTALLSLPFTGQYAFMAEFVLLCLGHTDLHVALSITRNILGDPDNTVGTTANLGHTNGSSSRHSVEIIYQLGVTQNHFTVDLIRSLLTWLRQCAKLFLRPAAGPRDHAVPVRVYVPAAEHVHCVAAILWHNHESVLAYDLKSLITLELIRYLFDWSSALSSGSLLKKSVDCVLCAFCHISPPYFQHVLEWLNIQGSDFTDDSKGFAQPGTDNSAPLTDDWKEGKYQTHYDDRQSYRMTDDSKEASRSGRNQKILSHLILQKSQLESLAIISQSKSAVVQLLESALPHVLSQCVAEFCNHQIFLNGHKEHISNVAECTQHHRCRCNNEGSDVAPCPVDNAVCSGPTVQMVCSILSFFAELCNEASIKDWLGSAEGNVFWPSLLMMLCDTAPKTSRSCIHSPSSCNIKVITTEHRSMIESSTIKFFVTVIGCHPANQLLFSSVLCNVIRQQAASQTGMLMGAMLLSVFLRRLLLQVLLVDDKVTVLLHSSLNSDILFCTKSKQLASASQCHIGHPRFSAGRRVCSVKMNVNSPCSWVLEKFADVTSSPDSNISDSLHCEEDDDKKSRENITALKQMNAAGILAQEKHEKGSLRRPPTRRGAKSLDVNHSADRFSYSTCHLQHRLTGSKYLPGQLSLSQLMFLAQQYRFPPGTTCISLDVVSSTHSLPQPSQQGHTRTRFSNVKQWDGDMDDVPDQALLALPSIPTALTAFASMNGLALLAEHLPLLFPDITPQESAMTESCAPDNNNITGPLSQNWVNVEISDELCDSHITDAAYSEPSTRQAARHVADRTMLIVPPHSMIAFGLFMRLPGYAEVLLKQHRKAQYLLRLVLGVADDGDGGQILSSPISSSLPTLPFTVLRSLLDVCPLTTDDGLVLRRTALNIGVVHLVLSCISVLSHHAPRTETAEFQQTQMILTAMQTSSQNGLSQKKERYQSYWAKGTGFGTGSTTSDWDAEKALVRQRTEEDHLACLLQVLGSYINPGGHIPPNFFSDISTEEVSLTSDCVKSQGLFFPATVPVLLTQSCLVPAISSYLHNDSVMDMARHIPLYRALLQLLKGIAMCPQLVPLLLPISPTDDTRAPVDDTSNICIQKLLSKMNSCMETYTSRLRNNGENVGPMSKADDEESEGLALLIPDIQDTARIVQFATDKLKHAVAHRLGSAGVAESSVASVKSVEERYMDIMGSLLFDTYELVVEECQQLKFNISHHFESSIKASGVSNNQTRIRRLAQEAVTLSTSLPLSFSSSVFVRCDEDRLDIMKVLITGPCDTPYANGVFEFDVYFPQDYPTSPPYINLMTTGNQTVRFNPNLYNDGKVCLSILNTWHGRPEEKWNAQTSSFLQVLVSIQSLILVAEPYFNEPGYERSRSTSSGNACSYEYDANIRQATVRWAMLEQIRDPSPCFSEVIQCHFWLKRDEILEQCEKWISEMELLCSDKHTNHRSVGQNTAALKYHYNQLRQAFAQMAPPSSLEDRHDTVAAPSYTAGGQTSAQYRQSATADSNIQPVCTGAAAAPSPSTLSEVSPSSQSSVSTSSVGVSTNPTLSDVRFSSHDQ